MKNRKENFRKRPAHEQEFFRTYLKWHLIGLALVVGFLIGLLVAG